MYWTGNRWTVVDEGTMDDIEKQLEIRRKKFKDPCNYKIQVKRVIRNAT